MMPWQTPKVEDIGKRRPHTQEGPHGCLVLAVLGALCLVAVAFYSLALTDAVGADQCVKIQMGRGVSHWECDCPPTPAHPQGRRLRFNTIPAQVCQ